MMSKQKLFRSLLILLSLLSICSGALPNRKNALIRPNRAFKKIHSDSMVPIHRGGDSKKSTSAPGDNVVLTKKINPHFACLYGMALALNAGYINGICLSGILSSTKQAGAAVTGAWTNSALGVASGDKGLFQFQSKCLLSYMGGSLVASLINPNPILYGMNKNTIRPSFLIASLAMYGSSVLSKNDGNIDWILLAAFANGIQNSISSSLTNNLMRSSHFSGITSDIGTFLGQSIRGNKTNGLKLKVFIVLAMSFWIGGYISLGIVERLGSQSLMISSLLYLLFGVYSS